MKVKIDVLLRDCIENGARRGYRRSFKHDPEPKEEAILENIEEAIMGEIYEYFTFDSTNQ